ncbi:MULTISPECIES: SDR family oxidoreductase [unclassified Arcicella]|uniref:SDR family oxidoreductase n=1 Tax=unclassified Arcicella TaxID=2644986 RepID=UPI00285FEAE2|nr:MULTISPECIES: SDR family oxidoreductase [unclassified Arcicella]MDR6563594.1 NAD(P)-dependent dehydrogenase (short-subunit alcohol dehydrogenase family) [Arcicella sp. BE51]MDR6814268.1 NAD(P)-dependent dehydrogenase (short-subunit alcohol dehydrogenase family) [Arcicella sp. BE140]MDR6825493.1 NAD(P)-dependent dehydrogenase (short-subunit alcohol dehydrogenase family) [Arcicella sp. BE139]
MTKTIFITGTSSGLGKASALYFAEQGWNVGATMRTPEKETLLTQYNNIKIFKLDVTNLEQVKTATAQAIEAFGKIDVVVNNAGMGTYGALELAKEEDIDWQFAVNTRGPINIIRAFLPHFRQQGEGMFINVSSFMGITTALPLGSLYNMSKFALEGLTEGLYYELKSLNIDVRLIEQGGSTDNNFVENIIWNTNPAITAYDTLTQKLKNAFDNVDDSMKDETLDIVKVIAGLANRENNAFRNVIGNVGNGLMALRNSIPIEDYLEKIYAPFV